MNRSSFSTRVLLLSFLLLLVSNGFGRKLLDASVHEEHAVNGASEQGKTRVLVNVLDYETGPNFNGRSSYPFPVVSDDPPQPPPPPPPPPPFGY